MSTGEERYSPRTDPFYQAEEPPRGDGQPEGVVISPDTRRWKRVPPGQVRTKKWPVLHYGNVPKVDPQSQEWRKRLWQRGQREQTQLRCAFDVRLDAVGNQPRAGDSLFLRIAVGGFQ